MMVRRDIKTLARHNATDTEREKLEIQKELLLCPPATMRSRILHMIEATSICVAAVIGGYPYMTFTTIVVCMSIAIAAMLHDSQVGDDIYLLRKAKASAGPTVSHFHTLAVDVLGQIYISFLWAHTILLLQPTTQKNLQLHPDSYEFLTIIYVVFITGMGENGGMMGGKLIGGTSLIPKISPKKTVAGFVGQILFSMLCAVLIAYLPLNYRPLNYTMYDGIVLGTMLGLLGAVGDLFESYIKRSHGLKDSNNIITLPGVGGVLDRIDGLIFNFAATYYYYHFRLFMK